MFDCRVFRKREAFAINGSMILVQNEDVTRSIRGILCEFGTMLLASVGLAVAVSLVNELHHGAVRQQASACWRSQDDVENHTLDPWTVPDTLLHRSSVWVCVFCFGVPAAK